MLADLPQSRWDAGTGRQVILKGDFASIEAAILQSFGILAPPTLAWVDNTAVKIPATADSPAPILLNGFPNILHPGMWVNGGLTDGRYRENIADATLDFDVAAALWGTEKTFQWYVNYALAGNLDTEFTLKAMPYMRVKSQASQVISLGTLYNPGTGIGYGFTTDELAGGLIYVLTGASRGLMREITANNNDNATGGTITYGGAALTLAQNDWFVVLPPGTNFRWVGDIFNNGSGHLEAFVKQGHRVVYIGTAINLVPSPGGWAVVEDLQIGSPLAVQATVSAGVTAGNVAYISHPSSPQGYNTWGVAGLSAGGFVTLEPAIQFCQYLTQSGGLVAVAYAYPPGCGY